MIQKIELSSWGYPKFWIYFVGKCDHKMDDLDMGVPACQENHLIFNR